MKQSRAFITTLRDVPKDADVKSQQLMTRAGMIQKAAPGIFTYLPLGLRVIRKFEAAVRSVLLAHGCEELLMPGVQPAQLWKESSRWGLYGPELLRFKDRKMVEFCLGPTHEEMITDVVRRAVRSQRQLPINLFQIQTKFRDEVRPRFGLMRGREFIMKDGYSFHLNDEDASREYDRMVSAYTAIFNGLGVHFRAVEADAGAIGGSMTHEFHMLAGSGEDALLTCNRCSYASNQERTESKAEGEVFDLDATAAFGSPLRLRHFSTAGITRTSEQLREMKGDDGLTLQASSGTKTMLLRAESRDSSRIIVLVIRADDEPSLPKLRTTIGADRIEMMSTEEAERFAGCSAGFFGPIGLEADIFVDNRLAAAAQLTCGANATGFHHFGLCPRRDLPNCTYGDYRVAHEGDRCARCLDGTYRLFRGIEVGQTFKLGTRYSSNMRCVYVDTHGKEQPMVMCCYGIGITRTVAAVVEQNYDEHGIIWPLPLAPYDVHLIDLDPGESSVRRSCDRLETLLEDAGLQVLHDDRIGVGSGEKFKDSDLIGIPIRLVLGARMSSSGVVQLRERRNRASIEIDADDVVQQVIEARTRMTTAGQNQSRHG